jgi:alkanesulfonate monooxygenase SsuD/methylene tetrahydromethanopterin reductase-like flavin-dependent oxidoreductase (luciferase family)
MENHGVKYETRFRQMREHVLAMKEIWTKEEAAWHGKMVNFDPIWSWPKPARRPHPPILLGGESDHTLKRVVEYCDGWFPRGFRGFDPLKATGRLHDMAKAAGRDPKTISVSVFGAAPDAAVLASFEKQDFQRTLLGVPDASRDEILRQLDDWAPLARAHQS